jgi:hypothetical protein
MVRFPTQMPQLLSLLTTPPPVGSLEIPVPRKTSHRVRTCLPRQPIPPPLPVPDTGGNDPLAAIRSINALASPDSRRYCLRSARRFHCRCRGRPTPFGNVPVTVREANTACFAPKSMIIPTQAIEGLYGRCAGCLLQGYASALSALCQPLDPRNVCALEGDDSRSRPKTQIDLGFQLCIPGPPDRPGAWARRRVRSHDSNTVTPPPTTMSNNS